MTRLVRAIPLLLVSIPLVALFAARRVILAQCAQIAIGQGFHQFFNLVLAQVASQQGNAPALLTFLEDVDAHCQQEHQRKNFHRQVQFLLWIGEG